MTFFLDSVGQDFRYALRQLRQSPGFTVAAVACLAIGVWLACVVSAVGRGFYRPENGFAQPDRVIQIDIVGLFGRDYEHARKVSRSVLEGLRRSRSFAAIGEYTGFTFQLADESRRRNATRLSSGMFAVFGIRPYLGRTFAPDEDVRGAGNVVLLSYDFWQRQFGGDSGVVGKQLRVNKFPAQTIIGVMPRGFIFPNYYLTPDVYIAFGSQLSPQFSQRSNAVRYMLARPRDGATLRQVEAEARDLAVRNIFADREELVADWAAFNQHYSLPSGPINVRAVQYYSEPWAPQVDRLMALIIGCGLCVVLIAGANVANLLLVRGAARRQEIAVRMALGASRARIVMQLIAESVLLSITGAGLGFILAFWQWRLLDSSFEMRHLLGQVDRHVAMTAALLCVALVAVFGLLPALRTSSMRLEQVLRDSRRSGMGVTKLDGLLARLVIGSTAGTVVLLACAALLGMSARDVLTRRKLQSKNVLAVDLSFERRLADREVIRQALLALEELSTRPGVRAVAIAPLHASATLMHVTPTGRAVINLGMGDAAVRSITGGYFATLSIPLVAGRTFTPSENRDGVGAVILGASAAQRLWPAESAVGKVARFVWSGDTIGVPATVVGVAADVTIRGTGTPSLEFYFPFGLAPSQFTTALARFGDERSMKRAALMKVRRASGTIIGEVLSIDERERRTNAGRYIYIGFGLFAGAGLILVTVGLYGVIAFSVARRTHEIGVRLALGAEGREVEWMITRQGLRMTLVGTAIGLVLSLGSAQLLRGTLPDVDPADPRVLVAIIGVVILVSLIASYIPSRRAAKLDPMNALRAE